MKRNQILMIIYVRGPVSVLTLMGQLLRNTSPLPVAAALITNSPLGTDMIPVNGILRQLEACGLSFRPIMLLNLPRGVVFFVRAIKQKPSKACSKKCGHPDTISPFLLICF